MDRAVSRASLLLEDPDEGEAHSLFESLTEAVRNSATRARLAAECTLASGGRADRPRRPRVASGAADLYAALEKQVDSILRSAGLAPDVA